MPNVAGSKIPFWDELSPAEAAVWEEEWNERAAIMEHHGGLSTSQAEVEAYRLVEAQYRAAAELSPLGKVGERAGLRAAPRLSPLRDKIGKADDQAE